MLDFGLDDYTPAATTAAPRTDREMVPEGEHDFQIRQVIVHRTEDKVEIRLEHPDRRYGWIFARLPRNQDWAKRILSSLRASLGYTRDAWAGLELTDLAGRRVRARIYHKGDWVNVAEFLPVNAGRPAPDDKPPAKRTTTQKADAASAMPEDDIPF